MGLWLRAIGLTAPLLPDGEMLRNVSGLTAPLLTLGKLMTLRPCLNSGLSERGGRPDTSDTREDLSMKDMSE